VTAENSLLTDLYRHQAWADARHLKAAVAHPATASDDSIRNRMLHIYTVQLFFRWMTGARSSGFTPLDPGSVADLASLTTLVRRYHDEMIPFVEGLSEPRLSEPVENPFAPPDAPRLTRAQALTQCAMHSHYHRGQNATRMRELGTEPPLTDFIAWFWSGQEEARWPEETQNSELRTQNEKFEV
jgi:uncharacterized damage-inducible protein DinB